MIFELEPVAKPRMTQRDRWAKRPATTKYWKFVNTVKKLSSENGYKLQVPLSITFVVGMPMSWPKKKREQMNGKPHTQRPDLDNYIKAWKDCHGEDSHIWQYGMMQKIWGESGRIVIHEGIRIPEGV